MLKDIGFWNAKGEYIEDIQEIDEMEMKEECKFLKDCQCDCAGTDDKVEVCEVYRLREENDNLREAMRKDFCSYYVLGECSQDHHNNCVGRNQCIKDLEQDNARLKEENEIARQVAKEFCEINEAYMKYEDCLKDIKAIAENGTKTEDYLLGQRYTDLIDRILDLITKAEEE